MLISREKVSSLLAHALNPFTPGYGQKVVAPYNIIMRSFRQIRIEINDNYEILLELAPNS